MPNREVPEGTRIVLRKGPLQTLMGKIRIGDEGTVIRADDSLGVLVLWERAGFATWCGGHDGSVIEIVDEHQG